MQLYISKTPFTQLLPTILGQSDQINVLPSHWSTGQETTTF